MQNWTTFLDMTDDTNNTPTRQQIAAMASNDLPVCRTLYGLDVQLVHDDLVKIEDWASIGAEVDMIACDLGLDLVAFKRAIKVCEPMQAALKRGRAKDKWEYSQALRAKSLEMSSPILSIWHGKQQFGMHDKQAVKHSGNTVVTIATGVPMPTTPDSKPPIEHDSQD